MGRCAVTRVALVWEHDGIGRVDPAPEPGEMRLRELARRNVRQPVCHVFERRILDATGAFDESLAHCQDWDLWLRFARVGVEFLPVDTALAWYRLRPDSLSLSWEGYLRDGGAVMRRALASDARCREPVRPPLDDPETVHQGMARFWRQNLLRAVNRGDETGVRQFFDWGRRNLPPDFWTAPERYGVDPEFDWAYDAPAPAWRTLPTLLDRGGRFLSSLSVEWPELGAGRQRRVARGLLSHVVRLATEPARVETKAGAGRKAGVAALAEHLGWMNWRVLGLAALLQAPEALRPGLLRAGRRFTGSRRAIAGGHEPRTAS